MMRSGERALLTVWRLSLATRWRRLVQQARSHALLTLTTLMAGLVAMTAFVPLARLPESHEALVWLIENDILAGVSAAIYAVLFVVRRRAHLRTEHSQSWLLATPSSKRAFRTVGTLRIVVETGGHALIVVAVLVGLVVANDRAIGQLTGLIAALLIGIATGSIVGFLWPYRQADVHSEDSRFIRKARASTTTPSLRALSRWPLAKAIAWHRPENSRVLFIIAALSVPVGTSALLGVAILAVWTLGSYLIAVVRAVPAVAREASIWLRPTTLPFSSFAWAIGRRAFVHQAIGTALLAGIFVLVGGRPSSVVYLATLWLALTIMIGMIGIRQGYLSQPAAGRTLLSLVLVVAAESRARGWGLPVAVIMTLAHIRGDLRERA